MLNWLEIPREQGADHLVMAPIRVRGEDDSGDDDAINEYLRLLHKERERAERTRQAYVALTRATTRLTILAPTPPGPPLDEALGTFEVEPR